MDGMTEHEKAIAWLWVVEGMATMKQVDVTLLQELLIEIGSALPDHMTNTVKERVSLRCLEEIFGPPNDSMNIDIPFTHHSKVTFDLSQSCETVLKRIIDETPSSDLKNSGPGLLKWDIHPFIVQKKSAMPKCALKQLKESILNGTHLHADVLREKSGLTCKKDSGGVPGGETSQSHNECLSNAQNMGVEVNSGLVHDISERDIHMCDLAENQMPMEENEVFEDGHNHYAEAKRFRRSNDGAFHENQTGNHFTATSMPQDTSQNEVQLYPSVGGAKNDDGLNRELRISNVAPPEETQHKVSSEEFNCYNKHDVHIEVPQVSVTDKLRERSNADERNGPDMPIEKHESVNDSEDYHTRGKSTIWDPSAILQSIEQNQLPLFLEESSERDIVRCDLPEDQTMMMEEDTIEEEDHGAYIHPNHKSQLENRGDAPISMPQDICQDGSCHDTCNDETMDDDRLQLDLRASGVASLGESQQKVSTKVFNNNTGHDFHIKGPHPATMDGPQQKNLANKGKDDSEDCSKLRTSTVALLNETQQKSIADKSKEPIDDDIDGLLYEKIDAIMKEYALLISECASSHDSSAITLKGNYHFVECDEGCQFLSCKTCNCPMVVPEYWLRNPHERDNLYCPLCSYKHSRTDYIESEKETSLRKKHQQAFNFAMENQPKEPVGSLPSKVNDRSRNFEETLIEKSYQNRPLEEHKESQGEDHVNEVDDRQFHYIIADKQQVAPSPCTKVSSRLAELHVSAGEEKGKKNVVIHEGMSIAGLARFQYHLPLEGYKLSSKNTGSFLIGQGQADAVPEQEDLQQNITDDSEDIHELTVNTEKIPEDDGSNTSKYSSRQRNKFPCTEQAITQSRRKKVPWTSEEEEMLKKGVQEFSSDERKCSWKQILEFGHDVFLPGRTPVDLKDKWKNMHVQRKSKVEMK